MSDEEKKKATQHGKGRPETGRPYDARFLMEITVGPRQLTPNNPALESEGWRLSVEEQRGVWLSHVGHPDVWAFIPWDGVRYVRYRSQAGTWPGEVQRP